MIIRPLKGIPETYLVPIYGSLLKYYIVKETHDQANKAVNRRIASPR
jgi:hypothetical protein